MGRAKIQLKPRQETPSAPEAVDRDLAVGENPVSSNLREDRRDKKIIAGHFPKSTWAELRSLCIKHDKTAQELLDEALTDLFSKYRS